VDFFAEFSMKKIVATAVAAFPALTMDQVNGLIALCALGVAAFAIYAVLQLAKDKRK
jgi:hypothetical protein